MRAVLALMLSVSVFWVEPSAAKDGATIRDLTSFDELADTFEEDAGRVRLIALLSPSCGYCVKGYRYMQRILEEVPDQQLRMYVVWEPMLSGDNRALAARMGRKAKDPRLAEQYWDAERHSGRAWQTAMDLPGVAWDVYFLYGPAARWDGDGPGQPDYWQHQGAGGPENWLDYQVMKDEIESRLAEQE